MHNELYMKIISFYSEKKDTANATKWGKKYLDSFSGFPIPQNYSNIEMAKVLLKAGFKKDPLSLLEKYAAHLLKYYKSNSTVELNTSREGTLYLLNILVEILNKNHLQSKAIESIILKVEPLN